MSRVTESNRRGPRTNVVEDKVAVGLDQSKLRLVERVNLKDQLARALRLAILTGQMRPGTTYTMGVLAEQYGASRTPIREAVLELEAKGLVEITRGVGFSVCELSPKEWSDAVEVRELLEVPAMRSLAGRLSAEELAQARSILARIESAAQANDIVEYLESDEQFHLFLIALAGNPKLTQIVSMLRDTQRVPGLAHIAEKGQLGSRHSEHVEILEAIESSDSERVADLVRGHLALNKLHTSDEHDDSLSPKS